MFLQINIGTWTIPRFALTGVFAMMVKFQGGDEKTLTPDDGSKYTIEFGPRGQLTARVDGNRGRGTWKPLTKNAPLGMR